MPIFSDARTLRVDNSSTTYPPNLLAGHQGISHRSPLLSTRLRGPSIINNTGVVNDAEFCKEGDRSRPHPDSDSISTGDESDDDLIIE